MSVSQHNLSFRGKALSNTALSPVATTVLKDVADAHVCLWMAAPPVTDCYSSSHSENYLVRWGSKGFPKEIEMLNNLKVVFTVSM